jgi:hypothetical protein
MTGLRELRIINDRIGAVFYNASDLWPWQSRRPMQWVKLDLKGKVLGRWEVGTEWLPRAFTRNGALYTQDGDAVLVFDRSTKAWRPVTGTASGQLTGADGDTLVFEARGTSTLRWVPAPQ